MTSVEVELSTDDSAPSVDEEVEEESVEVGVGDVLEYPVVDAVVETPAVDKVRSNVDVSVEESVEDDNPALELEFEDVERTGDVDAVARQSLVPSSHSKVQTLLVPPSVNPAAIISLGDFGETVKGLRQSLASRTCPRRN